MLRVAALRLPRCLLLVLGLAGFACTPQAEEQAKPEASVASGPTPAPSVVKSAAKELDLSLSAHAPNPVLPPPPSGDLKTVAALVSLAQKGVLPAGHADAFVKPGEKPKVVLVAAGAEPLQDLSYEFRLGTKEQSVMRMDMVMKMDTGAQPAQSFPIPTIEMRFDLATLPKRAENGDVAVSGTVTAVNVKPSADASQQQAAKEMEKAVAGIKGMTMAYSVSPKGRYSDAKVEVPVGASADAKKIVEQMRHSLESMATPLPDEKVGVGGQWLVLQRVSSGADILQWTTYTLKSKTGKKVVLEAAVKQLAASGSMSGGQMPAGLEAKITSFESGGTGRTEMDLTSLVPDDGKADVRTNMSFSAQAQSLTMDVAVKITFTRK